MVDLIYFNNMETSRFLFNCKVGVTNKNDLIIIDRVISPEYQNEKDIHHYDAFDETNTKDYSTGLDIQIPGYYFCEIYLVYETIHYAGGQDGTEYDSSLEFGELRLITK